MKLFTSIIFLLSILTTEVVVHIMLHSDHEISIIDNKTESEKESEKETGEDEKEKDIVDTDIINNQISNFVGSDNYTLAANLVSDNIIEITIPPPDLT